MATAIATQSGKQVARPLHVLVPLIKEDLQEAEEASQRAGLPYYRAAGEKMLEAKEQVKHGEFQAWVKRNFKISPERARIYMRLAENQNGRAQPFSSLADFQRKELGHQIPNSKSAPQSWHEPVKQILNRVDVDTLRDVELKRVEEREAQRKLALQLIDIGYKALATRLHPDKGGSRDAMARLNEVRDRLKNHA